MNRKRSIATLLSTSMLAAAGVTLVGPAPATSGMSCFGEPVMCDGEGRSGSTVNCES